jgi:hypothetical protein
MMCAFLQSSPHHNHQTTIMSKYKAPRRFNVLASEDTHSDYFRRSLMVASTQRRVRFSSTIKVSYPIPRPPLDGDEDEEEVETNAASSPSHCSSSPSAWYTSAELSTLRANATKAVLGYRRGDRSVDMHGLEKHVMIPTTTATTATATSFCAARRHSASSYHHQNNQHRHQSPPPPPVQRKVAPLNSNNNNKTKRDGSTTNNSPNSAARAA